MVEGASLRLNHSGDFYGDLGQRKEDSLVQWKREDVH